MQSLDTGHWSLDTGQKQSNVFLLPSSSSSSSAVAAMGGDDIGSDEEYLNATGLDDPANSDGEAELAEAGDMGEEAPSSGRGSRNQEPKRSAEGGGRGGGDGKKRPKPPSGGKAKSGRALLLETSRRISGEVAEVQAVFLWTCYSHSLRMAGSRAGAGEGEGESDDKPFQFRPEHFYRPRSVPSPGTGTSPVSLAQYLKGGALSSSKRLKRWREVGSPMVVVVTLSARRSVQLLKQLVPLRVRCAKLFAKHMSLDEQASSLREGPFGIAVGTPHRLLRLIEGDGDGGKPPLSLCDTELLVIDNHPDGKNFTVCTLNDTAPDLMRFLERAAVPQLMERDSLKLAMF